MKSRLLLLILAVVSVSALAISCGSGPISVVISVPKIEVVGQQANSESELFGDYAIIVKCRYLNKGSLASFTATSEVKAANGLWKKRQIASITGNQELEVVFEYSEVEYSLLGDNAFTYRCGWET